MPGGIRRVLGLIPGIGRYAPVSARQSNALVRDEITDLAFTRLASKKAERLAPDYLSLLPDDARLCINDLVRAAYIAKPGGPELSVFTDNMAREWLAQQELFSLIATLNGFTPAGKLNKNKTRPILAITINGSVIGLQQARSDGTRKVYYQRIGLRERIDVSPAFRGYLASDLAINERVEVNSLKKSRTGFISSKISALTVDLQENRGDTLGPSIQAYVRSVQTLKTRLPKP